MLLFVACCLSFVACCFVMEVCCPLSVLFDGVCLMLALRLMRVVSSLKCVVGVCVRCGVDVVRVCLLFVVCCLLLVARWLLVVGVVRCWCRCRCGLLLVVGCCLLFVACCLLFVVCVRNWR